MHLSLGAAPFYFLNQKKKPKKTAQQAKKIFLSMGADPSPDRVLVYARIKPQSKAAALQAASGAKTHPSQIAVRPADETTSSSSSSPTPETSDNNGSKRVVTIENPLAGTGEVRKFQLDGVFGPDSTQREVYDALGAPVLTDVLAGCRGCVLAYGEGTRNRSRCFFFSLL